LREMLNAIGATELLWLRVLRARFDY